MELSQLERQAEIMLQCAGNSMAVSVQAPSPPVEGAVHKEEGPCARPVQVPVVIRQPSQVARLRAHEFRTHADNTVMSYYPSPGNLRGGARGGTRFTEQKKKIIVSKEVG